MAAGLAGRDVELSARTATSRLAIAVVIAIPLAFLAAFFALPVGGMIARGLHPDGHWAIADAFRVLARPRVRRVLWFTLWMASVATVITTVLGMAVAYVTHRLRIPGRGLVRAVVVMPFVLPTVVVGVAFRTLLADSGPLGFLGWDGSWQAILIALVFFNVAVVVRTVGTAWADLDPRAEDAAAALDATPWTVFRTVTLPALKPSVIAASSVVFLFCATAFGVVLTLGGLKYGTLETEIYQLTTNFLDLRAAAVLSLVQFVVVMLLLAVTEFVRTRQPTVRRAGSTGGVRAVRRSDAAVIAITAGVLLLIVAPLVTLVVRSLQVDGGWGLDNYRRLTSVGETTTLLVPVSDALADSCRIAVDATLIAMVLGIIVSIAVTRRPTSGIARRSLAGLDAIFMLPLGISAVTVGFGFLITLDRPPVDLRSSPWLIPIAQALVALPLVVRALAPALSAVDERQREAAAALGASPVRARITGDLPVVIRPALAATGFAFAVSLGEFGATSFLARPDHPTLPVVIYALIGHPGQTNFGMALAASVILAGFTALVMALVERVGAGSVGSF